MKLQSSKSAQQALSWESHNSTLSKLIYHQWMTQVDNSADMVMNYQQEQESAWCNLPISWWVVGPPQFLTQYLWLSQQAHLWLIIFRLNANICMLTFVCQSSETSHIKKNMLVNVSLVSVFFSVCHYEGLISYQIQYLLYPS